jgi:hypothetical protein
MEDQRTDLISMSVSVKVIKKSLVVAVDRGKTC